MATLDAIEIMVLCRAATVGLDGIWNGGSSYRYEGASAAVVERLLAAGYLKGKKTRRQHFCPELTEAGWLEIAKWFDGYHRKFLDMEEAADAGSICRRLTDARRPPMTKRG